MRTTPSISRTPSRRLTLPVRELSPVALPPRCRRNRWSCWSWNKHGFRGPNSRLALSCSRSLAKLPAFLRTVSGNKPSRAELEPHQTASGTLTQPRLAMFNGWAIQGRGIIVLARRSPANHILPETLSADSLNHHRRSRKNFAGADISTFVQLFPWDGTAV